MLNPISSHQTHHYQVTTEVYEGPLDLLLQLIERAELDITKLALAQVTDQYLAHLRLMQEDNAEEVSAFLVIAARLLQIKSEALLPRPPSRQAGEEDPGEALAQQLILYKRYRQIADLLAAREESGLRTYLRLAAPPKLEPTLDLSGFGLADLVSAARIIFSSSPDKPSLNSVVAAPRVTIREKIDLITRTLQRLKHTTFQHLLGDHHTRLDVVVTFLAMLELVKRHLVQARQQQLFGEIDIEPSDTWMADEPLELEFGE